MSQRAAIYPGPCLTALPAHEAIYGPPPPETPYSCRQWLRWTGGIFSLVTMQEADLPVYRMQTTYELRTGSETEVAVTTQDFLWLGSGDPADEDFEDREDAWETMLKTAEFRAWFSGGTFITGRRWYKLKGDGTGVEIPQIRSVASNISLAGIGDCLPPQVACAVTEITSVRRRWGRFYLPYGSVESIAADGRLRNSVADGLAGVTAAAFSPTEDWAPIVYGEPSPHFLPVQEVQVDTTLDTMRSRRFKITAHRARIPIV